MIERRTGWKGWFTSSQNDSDTVKSVKQGQTVYSWYQVYDANTGDLFNSYGTQNYTVEESIYKPNGNLLGKYTYNKKDKNKVSFVASEAGTYKSVKKITFDGGTSATRTDSLEVKRVYTISYHAVEQACIALPESQEKIENENLTLTTWKPILSRVITYDANGGNVEHSTKSIFLELRGWFKWLSDEEIYSPGDVYTANESAQVICFVVYSNSGELETPTRTGYIFDGHVYISKWRNKSDIEHGSKQPYDDICSLGTGKIHN